MEFLGAATAPPLGSEMIARTRAVVSRRAALAACLLALICAVALLPRPAGGHSSPIPPAHRQTAQRMSLAGLPRAAQGTISATLGAGDATYGVSTSGSGLQGQSRAERLRMRFDRLGVQVRSRGTRVGLGLRAIGYGAALKELAAVAPRAQANRVTYTRPGVSEWYANGPLGLEQGFTISRAPSGHPSGPLTLSMALSGNARAALTSRGQSLSLSRSGGPSLRYSGLSATDARGRTLRSWLSLRAGRVLLQVDARGASYPLRIDPFIQQGAKLTGGSESGEGSFGYSVALSSDGNTALIGGITDNNGAGAVWVFTRAEGKWTQQGAKLTGGGEVGEGFFGYSVALSSDGNTALIGGIGDNGFAGAAWAFTRAEGKWTQQGAKLTGGGETGWGFFGRSVSLSSDGNTALIGADGDNAGVGAAFVFNRAGGKWTQQGAKLTGGSEAGEGSFGISVALAADGNTALIGGFNDGAGVGAAWVFTRAEGKWTQQGEKLSGGGESGDGAFGISVALSADGNTALIGAYGDSVSVGAAFVFTRAEGQWTQQGEKLTGGGEVGEGGFGISVSLSSDGNTALIGTYGDSGFAGAAFLFTRAEGDWSQQGEKLTGAGETGEGFFGYSVALSPDGKTALIGGYGDSLGVGAVWAFASARACTGEGFCAALTHYENPEIRFSEPNAVAVDPSRDTFVADTGSDRIVEFDAEGRYLRQFGSEGTGEGKLRGIGGIAANAAGDLYVTDQNNNRVQEFGPAGEHIRTFGSATLSGGNLITPGALAVDSSGNVWVLNAYGGPAGGRLVEFSSSGALLGKFGSTGTGEGQLGRAFGLAISGGNLYVAESSNSRVQEFSSSGMFIRQFDEKGAGTGKSNQPYGIATDPTSGNLYVTETANNRVQEFTAAGGFTATFGSPGSGSGQFSNPQGVAVGPSGTVFVGDTGNRRVQEWAAGAPPTFAAALTHYENPEIRFSEPNAVAVDPSRDTFVADTGSDRIAEFDAEGRYLRQFGSEGTGEGKLRGIGGIAANAAGDLYVTDQNNNRVQEFGPAGEHIRTFGSATLSGGNLITPGALAVDSSGNVWVLNAYGGPAGGRLVEFSSSGALLGKFGSTGTGEGQLGRAFGLAISGGNLYVAESSNSRVQEFSSSGMFIRQFDEKGAGTGKSNQPYGIATDPTSGNLYVTETANNRVQEFTAAGGFTATFGSPGSGSGQFSNPQGVAVGPSGTVFVGDTGNRRVQEWVLP